MSIVIQAGGESNRMGQDKALLPFLGQPLISRLLQRMAPIAAELLVITNHPEAFGFLDVPLVTDRLPGKGALGGLYTALLAARFPLVGVIACDMPFANPDLLRHESELLEQTGAAAVVPRTAAGAEPFHAVYRASACLPHIRSVLEAGRMRVDSWFSHVLIEHPLEDDLHRLDPSGLAFSNINTPEDFAAAEQHALNLK